MAIDRYHRQILLPQIGQSGQERLGRSTVLLIGCGALGSTIAEQLARSGVGTLRIVDRDIVELTNLQRQNLFDENDVAEGLPKVIAAQRRLTKINSSIVIDPRLMDVDSANIEQLVDGADLIVDGTDNVATRYLINDVSVKHDVPWVYGACVGTEGRVATLQPGKGPCLRCIFPKPPDPQELPTCDTAGVIGPVASVVGSLQALAAIKLLSGNENAVGQELLTLDLWKNRIHAVSLADAKRADCETCGKRVFQFLDAKNGESTARLCGRNAVQVRRTTNASLAETASRLRTAGEVRVTPFMVRCNVLEGGLSLTAFEDGRVIVQGTADPMRARAIVARYFGA